MKLNPTGWGNGLDYYLYVLLARRRLCAGCWLLLELEADRPSKRVLRDPACQPAGNMIQRGLDGLGVGVSSAARDAEASLATILGELRQPGI